MSDDLRWKSAACWKCPCLSSLNKCTYPWLCTRLIHYTDWVWVTHICASKTTIISSDNGLSPGWRIAIIWTNAGILLIGPLGTNFNEFCFEIHAFSYKIIHLKMSPAKCRSFCLGLNVLTMHIVPPCTKPLICSRSLRTHEAGTIVIHPNLRKTFFSVIIIYIVNMILSIFFIFWYMYRRTI